MALSKKARIRAKQIKENVKRYGKMSDLQIDRVFEKLQSAVKKYWAKKGLSF